METETSPTQMSKPTEETETETTTLEELEQPPPEEVLVLHEDEEPDTDPLGTLSDTEVEAIYRRLSKPEQKVYRELLRHCRKQMYLHNKMVPTYKEVRSTVKGHFPVIPSKDRDHLADAQRWLLAEERMKVLCKDLRYAMPERLTAEQSTSEDYLPRPTLRFELVGPEGSDEDLPEGQTVQEDQSSEAGTSAITVKQEGDEDMKPKLATSTCSAKYLRQMLGGMDDCMVTRLCRGNDLYSEFVIDNPLTQEEIILSSEEESEVNDLDKVFLDSMPVTGKELREVLTKLVDSHRMTGEHLATLAQMVGEMTADQTETTASTVSPELQGCPGLQAMFDHYDLSKIPLILAIGCKNYEETEKVKDRWAKPISYDRLVKVFGIGKQQIQDGCTRTSYRSSGRESEPPAAGRRGLHAKRKKLPASKSTEAGTTAEMPKQKEPQRVETTIVAPVETTEAAEAEATME